MTCVRETPCMCCEAGAHCAFKLKLDATQEQQVVKLLKLLGDQPQPSSPVVTSSPRTSRPEPEEPSTTIACKDCGRDRVMFTYLYSFLVDNHVRLPPCPVCVADRYAA